MVPGSSERCRVEGLERVRAEARLVSKEATQDEPLGAQRVGHERVSRNGQAALIVNGGDRAAQGSERPHRLFDPQRQEVAAERRDLLADDHLDAIATIPGHDLGRYRCVDPLVIGDGNDVQVGGLLDVLEDLDDARRPIGSKGMNVQVGAAETLGHGFAAPSRRPVPVRASGSRSGQIGQEDRPPLVRRLGDRFLHRLRDAGHRLGEALPSRAVGREIDPAQLASVVAPARSPHRRDPDREAALQRK